VKSVLHINSTAHPLLVDIILCCSWSTSQRASAGTPSPFPWPHCSLSLWSLPAGTTYDLHINLYKSNYTLTSYSFISELPHKFGRINSSSDGIQIIIPYTID